MCRNKTGKYPEGRVARGEGLAALQVQGNAIARLNLGSTSWIHTQLRVTAIPANVTCSIKSVNDMGVP